MGLDDFGLSVLAGWLGNKVDGLLKRSTEYQAQEVPTAKISVETLPLKEGIQQPQRFKTFDAWHDLTRLLTAVKEPLISILIEDQPSSHYRLASMVLESRTTGEWYIFSRGRMSFEGNGGGVRNSRDILDQVKSSGAAVGVWVLPQSTLDDLDNGRETWMVARVQAIPLLALVARDHSWSEIERNVAKYLEP